MHVGRRLVLQGTPPARVEGDSRFILRGMRERVVGDLLAAPPCDDLNARSFRLGGGEFSTVIAQTVDSCGNLRVSKVFDIRANDEQCLVEVQVRVRLVPLADPVDETSSTVWDVVDFLVPEGFVEPLYEGSKGCVHERMIATPAAVLERRDAWRRSIRRHWSRKHQIRALGPGCPCPAYDVDVDVIWVDDPTAPVHEVVNVHSGCGPADSGDLFVGGRAAIVAHEFGHWLGLDDEYPESVGHFLGVSDSCRTTTSTTSMMWAPNFPFFNDARVMPFHYHFFAEWLTSRKCCEFEIGRIEDIPGGFESEF